MAVVMNWLLNMGTGYLFQQNYGLAVNIAGVIINSLLNSAFQLMSYLLITACLVRLYMALRAEQPEVPEPVEAESL